MLSCLSTILLPWTGELVSSASFSTLGKFKGARGARILLLAVALTSSSKPDTLCPDEVDAAKVDSGLGGLCGTESPAADAAVSMVNNGGALEEAPLDL